MSLLAIIGTTACGKSNLAIDIAMKTGASILSLDSLSVYKEVNIASAKPTKEQIKDIKHYGIDVVNPDESFNVTKFFDLYKDAIDETENKKVPLIIVGGTSFYLKALLSGLSDKPLVSNENQKKIIRTLRDLQKAYEYMVEVDVEFAEKIEKNDKYRMEKWYSIYYETGEIPSNFLERTRKEPIIKDLPIFEIETDKEVLRKRIEARTDNMIEVGLVDEVAKLEKRYTREPNCMKAIGIKEVIEYFDGLCDLEQMRKKIVSNTAKLAKRQVVFNRTQFLQPVMRSSLEGVEKVILRLLQK